MNARKSTIPTEIVIYAFARTQQWLADFAESHALASHELTERVSALLLSAGEGFKSNLPALRNARSTPYKGVGKVALASSSHRQSPGKSAQRPVKRVISAAGRRAMQKAQRARWKRFHEQRKIELHKVAA